MKGRDAALKDFTMPANVSYAPGVASKCERIMVHISGLYSQHLIAWQAQL